MIQAVQLNPGNYSVWPSSYETSWMETTPQIRPERTTTVTFNEDSSTGTVGYY